MRQQLRYVLERDPAARGPLEVLLCYPGVHALALHRLSHKMWGSLPLAARVVSQLGRWLTGIEIHPGAVIARDVFIDHGMGVVIGETARIGKGCLIYQNVTLGGTGKTSGKRHPTLMENVVIGAGAKVLGDIVIGANSRVGAGSVVLRDVPENSTVVGVPGRVIKQKRRMEPLEHSELPDAEGSIIRNLMQRIDNLETEIIRLRDIDRGIKGVIEGTSEIGAAQSLRDKEIIEFLGGDEGQDL